jgi:hypothetical protein
MKKIWLFLFFLPTIGIAQNEDSVMIKKISDDILRNGKAYDLLRQLTKTIGGRLAGSPQMVQAEKWGLQTMQSLGADASYLQECMVPHWVRGKGDAVAIKKLNNKPSSKTLAAAALGNSMGSQAPIVADVLAVADFDELEKRKAEVKGKIVYYNSGFNVANIRPFKSYGESGIYRRNGASRAAKYGAFGVMIRSLSESTDNFPHTGAMAYNDSFPKIPAVALGIQDADAFWQLSKQNAITVSLLTHGKMLPDTIGHNVIGEIKGTQFPNVYITIGGHLDSWDLAEGAHDDGTGVVQTLEVLRALKALNYQPKHSIRFVLFANEENGTRGAEKYAAEAKAKNEKHIFALESDAGGFTPRGFGFTMKAAQLNKVQAWLPLLQPYGIEQLSVGGGGSDIGPLNQQFGTALGGLMPDGQRYFDIHHAANDVFENVNKRELLLGAVNMTALIYLIDKYGL